MSPVASSRLFQALVLMGCALAPVQGCAPPAPCDPDGGSADTHDAHENVSDGAPPTCETAWPPTK